MKKLITLILSITFLTSVLGQDKTILQGFYWDVEPGGVWYAILTGKAEELHNAGFDAVWFPPPSKGAAGGFDVGYTPYDYYDLGTFNQKGSIETRYGSKAELLNAISAYHNLGMEVYVDLVLNHRSGGVLENNIYSQWYDNSRSSLAQNGNGLTWTAFPLIGGSNRIKWQVGGGNEFFFPNAAVNPDNTFDFYSDSQLNGYHEMYVNSFSYDNALHDGFGNNLPMGDSLIAWVEWLTSTIGFDGYRFDFVKGIHPNYLKTLLNSGSMNGNFSVGELYDGDLWRLNDWVGWMNGTTKEAAVFDFNMRFAYKDLSDNGDGYDIRWWHGKGLFNYGTNYDRIVNFVENHDFDRNNYQGEPSGSGHSPVVNQKILCYAHMMMHPGHVMVWWRDYFIYGLKSYISELVEIRNQYAKGGHINLTALSGGDAPFWPGNPGDDPRHVFVMQRLGTNNDNGLILGINKHSVNDIEVWVTSQKWANQKLFDITGNNPDTVTVQGDGSVLLKIYHDSYVVYVPANTTPTQIKIDGVFEGESVWGQPVVAADGTAGFAGVNVDKLYVSYDSDYAYFAAKFKPGGEPEGWMRAAFAVNSRSGGGSNCPWGSGITFGHSDKPDFVLISRLENNYGELREWTGGGWVADKSNVYGSDLEWDNKYSYIEGRIERSRLNTNLVDVQFYVSGNDDDGNFDSCPDDQVTTALNSGTTLDNYLMDAVVPVELLSFNAVNREGSIYLEWSTITETNNSAFEIESSSDRQNWDVIASVEGRGTTSNRNDYVFIDTKNYSTGIVYYRLWQIDFDGSRNLIADEELEVIEPENFVLNQNYPNPFNSQTNIEFSIPENGDVSIEIYNVLGVKVGKIISETFSAGKHLISLDFSDYGNISTGVYFYRITIITNGNLIFTGSKKMIYIK